MGGDNPFDLDRLALPDEMVKAMKRAARQAQDEGKGVGRRARTTETFARIPHQRGLQLYGHIGGAAWVVLIELDRLIFKAGGRNPIRLTNQNLQAIGMSRSTKVKALRQLQNAGVITIKLQGREAVIVTHLWYPVSS
jgi:hypothetical protein